MAKVIGTYAEQDAIKDPNLPGPINIYDWANKGGPTKRNGVTAACYDNYPYAFYRKPGGSWYGSAEGNPNGTWAGSGEGGQEFLFGQQGEFSYNVRVDGLDNPNAAFMPEVIKVIFSARIVDCNGQWVTAEVEHLHPDTTYSADNGTLKIDQEGNMEWDKNYQTPECCTIA